jgi:DNA-directed RNA polymerase specialized sigma24 family protein
MRYLDELEVEEIAGLLEKDKNSIYVLIHRATKALQKALAQGSE